MDWLSLFLVILMIAVAYIQVVHGFISSLIMCVLVLICTVLAFASFEWLAYSFLMKQLGDLALPVAFMGTFVLPLIGLRVAMDMWCTRAMLLPLILDRGCGVVTGFITGMMVTGVLAVGMQMLPLGGSFLGHQGLDPESGEENNLWMSPDRFAVSFASMMSSGVFSGGRSWSEDHPDFISEIRNAQAPFPQMRSYAPPDSVRFVSAEIREYLFDKKAGEGFGSNATPPSYNPSGASPGKYWFVVRLGLMAEAWDADEQHRFTRRQVRLLGYESPNRPLKNFYPVGLNDNDDPTRAVRISDEFIYQTGSDGECDFLFEVPDEFAPVYIEYKLGGRVDLTTVTLAGTRDEPPSPATSRAPAADPSGPARTTSTSNEPPAGNTSSGGRVSGSRGTGRQAEFSNALPMSMANYQQTELEQNGGALVSGHIHGNVSEQGSGGISRFDVPADKRMFQLDVEVLRAGSTLGQALSFAVRSLKDYQLHDAAGNLYPVIGQYAIAAVNGSDVIEVQYFPEAVAATNRGGIREFARIKDSHLRGSNYQLVYLFLVEPGAQLTEFTTGAGRRPTDLRGLNLVAPN